MTQQIVNAAPMTIPLGVDDQSTKKRVSVPEQLPTHLPFIYGYAQSGPEEPQVVLGDAAVTVYGADTWDLRKPWATHTTVLANAVMSASNAIMFKRLRPDDANPNANVRLWLDVLPCKIPDYKRQSDGSIQLDATGAPVPTGQSVQGFKVKWVATPIAPAADGSNLFGQGAIMAGDQTDTTTSTQSQRYPVMDLEVPHFGADGNLSGFRMWAGNVNSYPALNQNVLGNDGVYPFFIQLLRKNTATNTPSIVQTLGGTSALSLTWKPGVIDKVTDAALYLGARIPGDYQNLAPADGSPAEYGPFGRVKVYDDNVKTLLTEFYTAEFAVNDSFSDFAGAADEEYLFNMVGGTTSAGTPYHSYQIVTKAANAVLMSQNSAIYASGGSDGTMDEKSLATLVSADAANWGSRYSGYQDTANYPVSVLYDSGFPQQTKYDLMAFMSLRKDLIYVSSTHDVLQPELDAEEESALGLAIQTRMRNFPESDEFGTPAYRGAIFARSGAYQDTTYTKPLPLTIEIAYKMARYMGAASGIWNSSYRVDDSPNNEVDLFTDVNITFTPADVRNKDWANGLNWVCKKARRTLYFPAMKTVYSDDTSVLTSLVNAFILADIEKIGYAVQHEFSGNTGLTRGQLVDRINAEVLKRTKNRYDNRVKITPNTYFTAADIANGFSWTLDIEVAMPNMRTVQTLKVTSLRLDDAATGTSA